MRKDNSPIINNVLIEIRYQYSMNKFEEEYGESVNYDQLIQETYVELKDIINKDFERKIKFRKHGPREGMVRTIRAEMYDNEFEKLSKTFSGNSFSFICNFIISSVKKVTDEELNLDK